MVFTRTQTGTITPKIYTFEKFRPRRGQPTARAKSPPERKRKAGKTGTGRRLGAKKDEENVIRSTTPPVSPTEYTEVRVPLGESKDLTGGVTFFPNAVFGSAQEQGLT